MNYFTSKIDSIRDKIVTMQPSATVSHQIVHYRSPEEQFHLFSTIGEEELYKIENQELSLSHSSIASVCFCLLCCCAVCDCSSAFLLNLYLTFTLLFKVIIYNLIPTIFLVLSIKLI